MRIKADLTNAEDPAVQELTKQYAIVGVPTVVFIDSAGHEQHAAAPDRIRKAGAVSRAAPAGEVTTLRSRTSSAFANASRARTSSRTRAIPRGVRIGHDAAAAESAHRAMQAAALLECAQGVRVRRRDPVRRHRRREHAVSSSADVPVYEAFDVDRNPEAIFEYWLVISDIVGATSWRMTRLIATARGVRRRADAGCSRRRSSAR